MHFKELRRRGRATLYRRSLHYSSSALSFFRVKPKFLVISSRPVETEKVEYLRRLFVFSRKFPCDPRVPFAFEPFESNCFNIAPQWNKIADENASGHEWKQTRFCMRTAAAMPYQCPKACPKFNCYPTKSERWWKKEKTMNLRFRYQCYRSLF